MRAGAAMRDLPVDEGRPATTPPEARGLDRDEVRLMVATPDGLVDTRFGRGMVGHLQAGDLVVVNTSPTMPAAVPGVLADDEIDVHLSTPLDDGRWVVELRRPDSTGPIRDAAVGDQVVLPDGRLVLDEVGDDGQPGNVRLWRASIEVAGGVRSLMHRHGRPIRYAYVDGEWGLDAYQTVFADRRLWPGSAEMASAGRPFTRRLLRALRRRIGVVSRLGLFW